jgi:hypothetical protein
VGRIRCEEKEMLELSSMKRTRKSSRAHKHAEIERISIAGIRARISPTAFCVYAEGYLDAARSITAPGFPSALVRSYLLCHAIELALKAFLSLKGMTMLDLADRQFAHDLVRLLNEAQNKGLSTLATLQESEVEQISRASAYYAEKVFEYPSVGEAAKAYPGTPNNESLLAAASALISGLREPCLHSD